MHAELTAGPGCVRLDWGKLNSPVNNSTTKNDILKRLYLRNR